MRQDGLILALYNRGRITFSSLKHKNFRNFWLGQCISWVGIWMQRTAQVWLIYTLTDSPFVIGLLGFFQFMPMLFLSLPAGVIVDRFPKKRVIYYTQIGFMVQSITLSYLVWSGEIASWHVLIMTGIFGSLQAIDGPARQSYFIDLVGKDDLANAISLNSTISQLAKFLGPIVAGLVMLRYEISFCFFLNGISYIAVFISLATVKEEGAPHITKKKHIMIEIHEGIRHITRNVSLCITILIMLIFCTFALNTPVIIPVFADVVLKRGVNGYTGLLSANGIGAFIGAIYMANRTQVMKCKQLIFNTLIISLIHITFAFTRNYYLCLLQMLVIGFLTIAFLNMANSILQINTSNEYRGRVMSIYTFVNQGSHPLGNIFAGTIMQYGGAAASFAGCGLLTILLFFVLYIKAPMAEYIASCNNVPTIDGKG